MGFSDTGRWVLSLVVVLVPVLVGGWFAARKSIYRAAQERAGYTGAFPVVAERPAIDATRQ